MCPNFLDWDVIMQSLSVLFVVSKMVLQQFLPSTSFKGFSVSQHLSQFSYLLRLSPPQPMLRSQIQLWSGFFTQTKTEVDSKHAHRLQSGAVLEKLQVRTWTGCPHYYMSKPQSGLWDFYCKFYCCFVVMNGSNICYLCVSVNIHEPFSLSTNQSEPCTQATEHSPITGPLCHGFSV